MVHTVIQWPHGGREVLLSFAFSGWTDRTRMAPVEGSSTIFQVICDLPPGCHQFKFLVDGVWRFDDQQLCIRDEHGGVNNCIVVETEAIPSSLHDEALTPGMDIDNTENAQDEASSSSVTPNEPALQLLDSDIDISRHQICQHMSNHKIFDLIPDSGKVFALDADLAVTEAFQVMYKQGLSIVPIWDGNRQQISGILSSSDFILILMELHRNRAMLPDEQLEAYTVSAWKEAKSQLYGDAVGAAQLMGGRPLIRASPDESLKDVALRILRNKISTIPIINSTIEGSCSMLLHIACLSGILKHICRFCRNHLDYLPLLRRPVGTLRLGTWSSAEGPNRVLTLSPSETLNSAFGTLIEARISSVPIVDDEGSLINVYSRSDITSLAKDGAYAHIQLGQTVISQALELVDGHRFQTCKRSDPFYVVMERLSDPVVRRLVVLKADSKQVEGIITLSDVFNFILN
ncbi:hypothetical protein NMG60_11004731 [Bertholletia excelsa]